MQAAREQLREKRMVRPAHPVPHRLVHQAAGRYPRQDPRLWNEDLAPTPPEKRTWTTWHVAALWVGMAVCIPTYLLASDMIDAGMSVMQSVFIVALGNVIVLVPMILNAHPGTRYGIPFPVFARASFGVYTTKAEIDALAETLARVRGFFQ